ncbi:MAG: ROK family protein [Pyramidobacter sp.]|nr:ROK family protein [Pyramidobacter sp.]
MIACADIGGHKTAVGLVENGAVLRKKVVPTPAERTPQAVCAAIDAALKELGAAEQIPLALAVPGMVSRDGTVIYQCPNMTGWDNVTAQSLSQLTGRRVTVRNDCDCAALGEMAHGAARGLKNFAFITLGTGVGGAIIINGELLRGARGRTGEIGHMPLMEDAGCACGGRGHTECFFSADALERAGERTGYGRDMSVLWENRENRWLAPYFGRAMDALACACTALTHLLDPEAIVIGGGMSNLPGLLDDLCDYMQPLLSPIYRPGPELIRAQLGIDAPLLGAAHEAGA